MRRAAKRCRSKSGVAASQVLSGFDFGGMTSAWSHGNARTGQMFASRLDGEEIGHARMRLGLMPGMGALGGREAWPPSRAHSIGRMPSAPCAGPGETPSAAAEQAGENATLFCLSHRADLGRRAAVRLFRFDVAGRDLPGIGADAAGLLVGSVSRARLKLKCTLGSPGIGRGRIVLLISPPDRRRRRTPRRPRDGRRRRCRAPWSARDSPAR